MRVDELPQVMKKHSRVRFTVSDNGMGMSEDYLKVIFDPFTREQTEATYEIQGTGLGMAITKSLVDLMGGSIKVASKLGEGSTFTVELELCIQEREDDPRFWTDCGLFCTYFIFGCCRSISCSAQRLLSLFEEVAEQTLSSPRSCPCRCR